MSRWESVNVHTSIGRDGSILDEGVDVGRGGLKNPITVSMSVYTAEERPPS